MAKWPYVELASDLKVLGPNALAVVQVELYARGEEIDNWETSQVHVQTGENKRTLTPEAAGFLCRHMLDRTGFSLNGKRIVLQVDGESFSWPINQPAAEVNRSWLVAVARHLDVSEENIAKMDPSLVVHVEEVEISADETDSQEADDETDTGQVEVEEPSEEDISNDEEE